MLLYNLGRVRTILVPLEYHLASYLVYMVVGEVRIISRNKRFPSRNGLIPWKRSFGQRIGGASCLGSTLCTTFKLHPTMRVPIHVLILLVTVLVCTSISSALAHNLHAIAYERQLELDCPVRENTQDEEDGVPTTRLSDYSKGELGRKLVENVRGKSKTFYQATIDDVIMATCDLTQVEERCVEETSLQAAKDWKGECIVAANNTCPPGYCERASNCYWKSVVAGSQRETRYPHSDYADASNRLISYERDSYAREIVVKFVLPGTVIGIATLIFWLVFFVGRYCCCCLWSRCGTLCYICAPIPKRRGYRKCLHIIIPIMAYLAALSAMLISGSVSYIGNEDISLGASKSFVQASGMIEDLGSWLERSRVPLDNTQNIIYDAAAEASAIFSDTSYVKTTALSIVESFANYATIHLDGLIESNAEDNFASALDGFNDQVQPFVDEVEEMLDVLETDLTDNVDMIQVSIVSAVVQIDSINGQTATWQNEVHKVEGQEYSIRTYRKLGVMLLFLTGLVVTFAGSIGIFTSKTKCKPLHKLINVAGILCAILASISFVLGSVSLGAAVLWSDGCQMVDIITSDFEPIVGDKVATVADAIWNDTNLAVAFNMTDKLDWQAKFEEGLAVIDDVNVTDIFANQVLSPLDRIQEGIDMITVTGLGLINQGTTFNNDVCPFDDEYTKGDIMEPWLANTEKITTAWITKATGTNADYSRIGDESGSEYMARIYGDVAGVCSASDNCCFEGTCVGLAAGAVCNGGTNCQYPCAELGVLITTSYTTYLDLNDMESGMTADLGLECPSEYTSCPTAEFMAAGNDETLVELLLAYEANITSTADSLVNLATTSVGDVMDEVQDLMCNMNVSFVKRRYDKIETEFCGRMLGGFAQVTWALWAIAVFLEIAAITANILSVRLHGTKTTDATGRKSGQWIMPSEAA